MSRRDFLPARDQAMASWGRNFSQLISAAPGDYGPITPAQAAELAALTLAYTDALTAARTPITRTPPAVQAKTNARAAMVVMIRQLARIIHAAGASDEQKRALGLPVRSRGRTPVPPPATRPVLALTEIQSRTLKVRLTDELTPTRRSRPAGTEGAAIYSCLGTPPDSLEQWRFEGIATRSIFTCTYEGAAAGQTATVRAAWISTRGEQGPPSDPITATIAA